MTASFRDPAHSSSSSPPPVPAADEPASAATRPAGVPDGSTLDGEIEAEKVDLEATGLSRVTLKGVAKEAKISASQQGHLFLTEFVLDRAEVTLKHGSTATVNVKERLDYDLSTSCRLEYLGSPASTKGRTSGDSSALPMSPDSGKTGAKPNAGNPPQAAPAHRHHGGGSVQGPSTPRTGAPAPGSVAIGEKVPDFSLRDLDGSIVKFSELQKNAKRTENGVVVLSFWCSTCASCRRVERRLDKLTQDYRGRALVFALDANAGETPHAVSTFAKKNGLTLPIFLNPDGRAADIFGTQVTTTTVVIDGQGVLRYCGRFSDGDRRAYAEDALKAVLTGKEVGVKTTPQDG